VTKRVVEKLRAYEFIRNRLMWIGIDTHSGELSSSADIDLKREYLLMLKRKYQRDANETKKEFLNDFPWVREEQMVGLYVKKIMTGGGGMGHTRICSRFLANHETLKNMQTEEELTFKTLVSGIVQEGVPLFRGNDRRLDVYLITTLGGGTGSGSFIPFTTQLKRYLGDNCGHVIGIFFLPSGLEEGGSEIDAMKNAYAALKEIHYLFKGELEEGEKKVPSDLFDFIILVGKPSTVTWDALDGAVIDMITNIVVLPESPERGITTGSDKSNLITAVEDVRYTVKKDPIGVFSIGSVDIELDKMDKIIKLNDETDRIKKQLEITEQDEKDLEKETKQSFTKDVLDSGKGGFNRIQEIADEKAKSWNIENWPKHRKIKEYFENRLAIDKEEIRKLDEKIKELEKILGNKQDYDTEERCIKFSWLNVSKEEEDNYIEAGREVYENYYIQKKILENTRDKLDNMLRTPPGSLLFYIPILAYKKIKAKAIIEPELKTVEEKLEGKKDKKGNTLEGGLKDELAGKEKNLNDLNEEKQTFEKYEKFVKEEVIDGLQLTIKKLEEQRDKNKETTMAITTELVTPVQPDAFKNNLKAPYHFANGEELNRALGYRIKSKEKFFVKGMCDSVWGERGIGKYQNLLRTLAENCIDDNRFLIDVKTEGEKDRDYRLDRVYMLSSSSNLDVEGGIDQMIRNVLETGDLKIGKEWIRVTTGEELGELHAKLMLMRLVVGWDYSKELEELRNKYNMYPKMRHLNHAYPVADKEDPFVRVEAKKN
jgi:hypothetical protein